MKLKNYAFLLVLLFGFQLAQSQNLVVNGDLESWTAGEPDGWTVVENITQETTTIHGGASAASHMSDETTKDLQQLVEGIVGGQEYTISYWYYDNDPMARTRVWSYWTSAGSTLPDHGEILRPGTYSEDNGSWMEFNQTLVAPLSADGFKLEVRVYKQDGNAGGWVIYDDFVISGDVVINPEPSNYPTAFVANTNGTGIDLTWTDATGAQLPLAYIIMAGTDASLPVPVDGTPVENDTDLSDGSGALNVSYGEQMASFPGLEANTTYYFTIYPYSNTTSNINYKTEGTVPTAEATTSSIFTLNYEDFEDGTLGTWWQYSVASDHDWLNSEFEGNKFAKANGYGGDVASDDWLISPPLNLENYINENLTFETAKNWDDIIEGLEVKISEDYAGSGDPYDAVWTVLSATLSTGDYEWTSSGDIDISSITGSDVYIAFHYISTGTGPGEATTWEVDNISITGEQPVGINNPNSSNECVSIFPNPSNGTIYVNMENDDYSNIEIRSLTGSLIRNFELNSTIGTYDLSELQTGIYFVVFSNENNNFTETHKLIIR